MARKKRGNAPLIPMPDDKGARVHKAKRSCPHLAAELFDNGQGELGDEMMRGLKPWAKDSAQKAGRRKRSYV